MAVRMRNQDNKNYGELIREMRDMGRKKHLTLENVIFSDEDREICDSEGNCSKVGVCEKPQGEKYLKASSPISKIRMIALQRIAELADETNSPEYELMKKIWNMCDQETKADKKDLDRR